jgi:tRNA-(ms[2]io[6]A)-hydroxylase
LQEFYAELSRAEARHQGLFVKLAREYFSADEVAERLDQLLAIEAEVIEALPLRPVLH